MALRPILADGLPLSSDPGEVECGSVPRETWDRPNGLSSKATEILGIAGAGLRDDLKWRKGGGR